MTGPGAEGTAPNPWCSHCSLEWGQRSTSGWTGAQGLSVRLSLCNKQLSTRRLTEHIYSLTDSKGQEPGRSLRGPLPRVLRESFPRQVDRESRGPQGERGLEFSRRKKGQTFFSFSTFLRII